MGVLLQEKINAMHKATLDAPASIVECSREELQGLLETLEARIAKLGPKALAIDYNRLRMADLTIGVLRAPAEIVYIEKLHALEIFDALIMAEKAAGPSATAARNSDPDDK